jgi:hypothetical protein
MKSKKKSSKTKKNKLTEPFVELAKQINQLALQAVPMYATQVEDIISTKCTDANHIERTLDGMMDFCFNEKMVLLFKKLCRYYYYINAAHTAEYVEIYRQMWDSDEALA